MPPRPTQQQIDTAAMWLESNEGEGDERTACVTVATWIKTQAFEHMLRTEARAAGITVASLRRKLESKP